MSKVSNVPDIFNRRLIGQKRSRAAKNIKNHNFIHEKTANELIDRLATIAMDLPNILVWGAHTPILCQKLSKREDVQNIYWTDICYDFLSQHIDSMPEKCSVVLADEELSPFLSHSLDAVVSNLMLHSVNDLRGALVQIKNTLKPNRPFVGVLFGAETLLAAKHTLMQVEEEQIGGASLRVSPFIDIKTLGNMMQSLGFVEPVIDSEIVSIKYSSLASAMADIRGMGEGSILKQANKKPISRQVMSSIDSKFKNDDVSIQVELLYVIAWSPSEKTYEKT